MRNHVEYSLAPIRWLFHFLKQLIQEIRLENILEYIHNTSGIPRNLGTISFGKSPENRRTEQNTT